MVTMMILVMGMGMAMAMIIMTVGDASSLSQH